MLTVPEIIQKEVVSINFIGKYFLCGINYFSQNPNNKQEILQIILHSMETVSLSKHEELDWLLLS